MPVVVISRAGCAEGILPSLWVPGGPSGRLGRGGAPGHTSGSGGGKAEVAGR